MIALVTGSSGFLGSRLCAKLLAEGWTVRGLSRTSPSRELADHPGMTWSSCDLSLRPPSPAEAAGVDVVFHAAAAKDDAGGEASLFASANEIATVNVLKACSGKAARIVFCSSQVVYGDVGRVDIGEEFPLVPDTAYATSKINAENWLRHFQHRRQGATISLRLCGLIETGGAIGYHISQAAKDKPIEVYSRGAVCRDYVAADDAVGALLAAGKMDLPAGRFEAYNIGSGERLSTLELANLICKEMGSRSAVLPVDKPAPRRDCVLKIDKARRDLGFSPAPLSAAVRAHIKRMLAAK